MVVDYTDGGTGGKSGGGSMLLADVIAVYGLAGDACLAPVFH